MKTLIVYYSLEGNTEYAAKRIAKAIGADMLRLVPVKEYSGRGFSKYLWGGKSVIMAEKPKLEKYRVNLRRYDRIVFGFPVWAACFAPPIRTFITQQKRALQGKRIAAFACQGGHGAEKAMRRLKKLLKTDELEAEGIFIEPKAKPQRNTEEAINAFSKALKEGRKGFAPAAKVTEGRAAVKNFFSHWNYRKHAKLCATVYLTLFVFDMTISYFICKRLLDKADQMRAAE